VCGSRKFFQKPPQIFPILHARIKAHAKSELIKWGFDFMWFCWANEKCLYILCIMCVYMYVYIRDEVCGELNNQGAESQWFRFPLTISPFPCHLTWWPYSISWYAWLIRLLLSCLTESQTIEDFGAAMHLLRTDLDHLRSVFVAVENGDLGRLKSLGIKDSEIGDVRFFLERLINTGFLD